MPLWFRIIVLLLAGAALTMLTSIAGLPLYDTWADRRAVTADDTAWWQANAPPFAAPPVPTVKYANEWLGCEIVILGEESSAPGLLGGLWVNRRRSGLPWPAFECEIWTDPVTGARHTSGDLYLPWARMVIPVRPLPLGFAASVLLYAAPLALAPALVKRARLQRRHWRGRCGRCAYPVGVSDVCTECGAAVPASARSEFRSSGYLPWLWRHHRGDAALRMLFLGAILTVVIALMLAVAAPRRMQTFAAVEAGLRDRPHTIEWFRSRRPGADVERYAHFYEMRSVGCERLAASSRDGVGTRIYRYRAGWPLYALEGVDWMGRSHLPMRRQMASSPSTMFIQAQSMPIAIPLRPMASGFAMNTLFYASLLGGYVWLRLRLRCRRLRQAQAARVSVAAAVAA